MAPPGGRLTGRSLADRFQTELRCSARAAWRALVQLVSGNDLTHASAIAFYSLLSLFPFLLLVMTILGIVAADDADRAAVMAFLLRYFPVQSAFLTAQLDAAGEVGGPTGVAGILTLLWASLGVFGAITTAVNEAWGTDRGRSFLGRRLLSLLILGTAGLVLVCGLLLLSLIQATEVAWIRGLLIGWAPVRLLESVTLRYLPTLLAIAGSGFLFYVVPNTRLRFRDVWLGAILTGLLWRTAFALFAWYVRTSTALTLIHGSVAAVAMFLLWVYVSAVILLYGVEFTAAHSRMRQGRTVLSPARE